jgi:ubiquinone/menaquinone biosynthesis C-methylase UbiE
MAANMDNIQARIQYSGYQDPGFAATYDATRPPTPPVAIEIILDLARIERPQLVLDLGAGTGTSTRPWAAHADAVVGIEPNPQMREQAEKHQPTPPNVSYQAGYSHDTGLAPSSVDVVTCAQSLNWMEPGPTFAEVARVLRPGGVFAAYNREIMPTGLHWEVDAALQAFDRAARQIRVPPSAGDTPVPEKAKQRWHASGHLRRLEDSGLYRYVTELSFHHQVEGDLDQLFRYIRSIAGVHRLLSKGTPEQIALLDQTKQAIELAANTGPWPWLWVYRMWVAVR